MLIWKLNVGINEVSVFVSLLMGKKGYKTNLSLEHGSNIPHCEKVLHVNYERQCIFILSSAFVLGLDKINIGPKILFTFSWELSRNK